MRNKLKISSFEKIHHVALNENKFKTMNNLFIDNDNNDSSSDNFMLTMLFTYFIFLIVVLDVTAY